MQHLDAVIGFRIGVDTLSFEDVPEVSSMADLKIWKTQIDGVVHFVVKIKRTDERILVEVDDPSSWGAFQDPRHFTF